MFKPIWEIIPVIRRAGDGRFFYDRGLRYPAWALLAIPFVLVLNFVLHVKTLRWFPLSLSTVLFFGVLIFVEHASIFRGHWVYNKARLLGIYVWGIPVEELVIYYVLPVFFVVGVFEWLSMKFGEKR